MSHWGDAGVGHRLDLERLLMSGAAPALVDAAPASNVDEPTRSWMNPCRHCGTVRWVNLGVVPQSHTPHHGPNGNRSVQRADVLHCLL